MEYLLQTSIAEKIMFSATFASFMEGKEWQGIKYAYTPPMSC